MEIVSRMRHLWLVLIGFLVLMGLGRDAHAQIAGPFKFQLFPRCNIVTLTVTLANDAPISTGPLPFFEPALF